MALLELTGEVPAMRSLFAATVRARSASASATAIFARFAPSCGRFRALRQRAQFMCRLSCSAAAPVNVKREGEREGSDHLSS